MVLGTAGLDDEHDKQDRRGTGTGEASRGPAAVEDRRGYPSREHRSRETVRPLVLH
jgi:hypothetical protein